MTKKSFNLRKVIVIAICLAGNVTVFAQEKGNDILSDDLKTGQFYQGGIIAYVDSTGRHGLIVAPEDQSCGIKWYKDKRVILRIGGTEKLIGTGKINTTKIVECYGEGNYAAKLCDDLVLNGYDDWYLPSIDELKILCENRYLIGGFIDTDYWSSSENDNLPHHNVFYMDFSRGVPIGTNALWHTYRVRAVRAF